MSTQSVKDFEWSVKLIGDKNFHVGNASVLRSGESISFVDSNTILYSSNFDSPIIRIGTNTIHSNLPEQKTGDVIHFKFQPQKKKFMIELVRICFPMSQGNLERTLRNRFARQH